MKAGLAGGTLMYAGQRMVGTGHDGLRFAGLQTVAVGASMARNLGRGDPALSEITLPIFPLYVRFRSDPDPVIDVRVSALALVSTVVLYNRYGEPPDLRESLISGAPVFAVRAEELDCLRMQGGVCVVARAGTHLFGAYAHARDVSAIPHESLEAHEAGHLAQDVRDAVLHAVPASDRVLRGRGFRGWLGRHVVFDLFQPLRLLDLHATGGLVSDACGTIGFTECEADAMLNGPAELNPE